MVCYPTRLQHAFQIQHNIVKPSKRCQNVPFGIFQNRFQRANSVPRSVPNSVPSSVPNRPAPLRSVTKGHWMLPLGSSRHVRRAEGRVVKAEITTTTWGPPGRGWNSGTCTGNWISYPTNLTNSQIFLELEDKKLSQAPLSSGDKMMSFSCAFSSTISKPIPR